MWLNVCIWNQNSCFIVSMWMFVCRRFTSNWTSRKLYHRKNTSHSRRVEPRSQAPCYVRKTSFLFEKELPVSWERKTFGHINVTSPVMPDFSGETNRVHLTQSRGSSRWLDRWRVGVDQHTWRLGRQAGSEPGGSCWSFPGACSFQ